MLHPTVKHINQLMAKMAFTAPLQMGKSALTIVQRMWYVQMVVLKVRHQTYLQTNQILSLPLRQVPLSQVATLVLLPLVLATIMARINNNVMILL